MDASEKYRKMCEKAGEVREHWNPHWGDWYMEYDDPCSADDPVSGYYGEWKLRLQDNEQLFSKSVLDFMKSAYIYLPRQDQLQEMLQFECGLTEKHHRFYEYIQNMNYDREQFASPFQLLESFEQLWLAFVMHEKYGKVWDDGKNEWLRNCPTSAHTFKQEKDGLSNEEN